MKLNVVYQRKVNLGGAEPLRLVKPEEWGQAFPKVNTVAEFGLCYFVTCEMWEDLAGTLANLPVSIIDSRGNHSAFLVTDGIRVLAIAAGNFSYPRYKSLIPVDQVDKVLSRLRLLDEGRKLIESKDYPVAYYFNLRLRIPARRLSNDRPKLS